MRDSFLARFSQSIDEVEDDYSSIQTVESHHDRPAPMPSTPSTQSPPATQPPEPPAQETEDVFEDEQETELAEYAGIQLSGDSQSNARVKSSASNADGYSYAQFKVRKTRLSSAGVTHEDDGIYTVVNEHQVAEPGSADSCVSDEQRIAEDHAASDTYIISDAPSASSKTVTEYSTAIPKHERPQRSVSVFAEPSATPVEDEYVTLRESAKRHNASLFSNKSMLEFCSVPPLAHARVEYTERSHFDDIRLFLSHNRKHNEVFREVPGQNLNGGAINKLTAFLADLDSKKVEADPATNTAHISEVTRL